MEPLLQILKRLSDEGADFVLVGGMAATVQGAEIVTQDVDVCIPFDLENMTKVERALRGINPRFRFRPDRMRMWDDPARLATLKNLNVVTDLGVVDFLGEISGIGGFVQVKERSEVVTLAEGFNCHVLNLEALIVAKRTAGRPKDLQAVRELEVARKLRDSQRGSTGPD